MHLDSISSVIDLVMKSYFFMPFLVSGSGVSRSKDVNGACLCFGDSIGRASNNICDSSSSKGFNNRCINKCTS